MMDQDTSMEQSPLIFSQRWSLSDVVDSEGKRFIRAPIAVLGEWVHPEYGPVKFAQKDFDDIMSNWSKGVTGYEPPLFLGHNVSKEVIGGEPAVAFLEKIYQQDDVLFGEYDPVDDEAFESTRKGQYRYASAEVVRNAIAKETGEKVGTLLVGHALTNTPFLSKMPRVEAGVQQFSQPEGTAPMVFTLCISENLASTSMSETTEVAETKATTETKAPVAPAAETVSAEMLEQFADLVKSVEGLRSELTQTKQALSDAQSQLKAQSLEKVLTEVEALNLTTAVKDKYSEMLRQEKLSESQQTEVMALLRDLSKENAEVYADRGRQQDSAVETEKVEIVNPYADIISQNQKFAETRKAEALSVF